jgi:hypothetical protein
MESRHVSTVIERIPEAVYEFIARPENLPQWAAGLAQSEIARDGDAIVADSPMGRVTIRFVPRNDLGVADHEVTVPSGETVYNALRVIPHPYGSEVVFTLRQLNLSDEAFEQDAALVLADLTRLKALLEG